MNGLMIHNNLNIFVSFFFFDICACIGVVMYLCSYSFAVTHFSPRIHHRHTHTDTDTDAHSLTHDGHNCV